MSGRAPRHPAVQFSGTGRERISSPDRCELILTPASESVSYFRSFPALTPPPALSLSFVNMGPGGEGWGPGGFSLFVSLYGYPLQVYPRSRNQLTLDHTFS